MMCLLSARPWGYGDGAPHGAMAPLTLFTPLWHGSFQAERSPPVPQVPQGPLAPMQCRQGSQFCKQWLPWVSEPRRSYSSLSLCWAELGQTTPTQPFLTRQPLQCSPSLPDLLQPPPTLSSPSHPPGPRPASFQPLKENGLLSPLL